MTTNIHPCKLRFVLMALLIAISGIYSFTNAQKAVNRLPNDSTYKNLSGKTMWVLTGAALDTFTVNMIQNKTCKRIGDSLQVQVKLLKNRGSICDTALVARSKEALMWHTKLDSCDVKLQNTEIELVKEKQTTKKWMKATFGSAGAALVFLVTSIILAFK